MNKQQKQFFLNELGDYATAYYYGAKKGARTKDKIILLYLDFCDFYFYEGGNIQEAFKTFIQNSAGSNDWEDYEKALIKAGYSATDKRGNRFSVDAIIHLYTYCLYVVLKEAYDNTFGDGEFYSLLKYKWDIAPSYREYEEDKIEYSRRVQRAKVYND